jgi:hypothetical protein
MIGWDFSIFWQIGQAVLTGHSPYSVELSRYPPAAAFLFVLFALLPFALSFAVWTGITIVLAVHGLRRMGQGWKGLAWLLYTPLIFNLMSGQLDVIFWWAALYLEPIQMDRAKANWISTSIWIPALAGTFMMLKPQLAAVVLPWYLFRWVRRERGLLLRWAGLCALLYLLPLLYDPLIYHQWFTALRGVSEMKSGVSAGIFAFGLLGLPTWLLAILGLSLAVWGWFQEETISRPAQLSAFPLTIWYDDMMLAGYGPAWLLVPVSWLAFVGAALVQNSLPLVAIPMGTLVWAVIQRKRTWGSTTAVKPQESGQSG